MLYKLLTYYVDFMIANTHTYTQHTYFNIMKFSLIFFMNSNFSSFEKKVFSFY